MYSCVKDMGVYLMRSDLVIKMFLQKSLEILKIQEPHWTPAYMRVFLSAVCEAACQARQSQMMRMIRADMGCLGWVSVLLVLEHSAMDG